VGTRIYQEMPPIPDRVVSGDGTVVFDAGEIHRGLGVWQSMGGMEVGSIWGHGSYVAPDWTADWLHREAIFILDRWANSDFGTIRYQQPVCFADVVPDAIVNIDDLVAVITGWGLCPGGQAGCTGDVSPLGIGDGIVNIDDLVAVITTWGQCP
jgi:hypothetical protein